MTCGDDDGPGRVTESTEGVRIRINAVAADMSPESTHTHSTMWAATIEESTPDAKISPMIAVMLTQTCRLRR